MKFYSVILENRIFEMVSIGMCAHYSQLNACIHFARCWRHPSYMVAWEGSRISMGIQMICCKRQYRQIDGLYFAASSNHEIRVHTHKGKQARPHSHMVLQTINTHAKNHSMMLVVRFLPICRHLDKIIRCVWVGCRCCHWYWRLIRMFDQNILRWLGMRLAGDREAVTNGPLFPVPFLILALSLTSPCFHSVQMQTKAVSLSTYLRFTAVLPHCMRLNGLHMSRTDRTNIFVYSSKMDSTLYSIERDWRKCFYKYREFTFIHIMFTLYVDWNAGNGFRWNASEASAANIL